MYFQNYQPNPQEQFNRFNQPHGYYNVNRSQPPFIQRNLYQMQRRISAQDAIVIALESVPGDVVDVELDTENGILAWEIEIMTAEGIKYEVYVNANTGEVIKVELD